MTFHSVTSGLQDDTSLKVNQDDSGNNYVTINIIYFYGLDSLWHKMQIDANGLWGETAAPQAGPPPF